MILKSPPIFQPIIDKNGMVTAPWRLFFNELYRRLGNVESGNYAEFSTTGSLSFNSRGPKKG